MVINAAFLTKTFIALKCSTWVFSGVTQQSQMAQNLQETPIGQRNFQLLCPAFIISCGPPSQNYSGLHRYSNFFFGNFIVRQPAFWVCCFHCSQLMLLTLFLARLVSPRPAQKERMKNLTLFYALFLLVCFISQEWRWGNYSFQ